MLKFLTFLLFVFCILYVTEGCRPKSRPQCTYQVCTNERKSRQSGADCIEQYDHHRVTSQRQNSPCPRNIQCHSRPNTLQCKCKKSIYNYGSWTEWKDIEQSGEGECWLQERMQSKTILTSTTQTQSQRCTPTPDPLPKIERKKICNCIKLTYVSKGWGPAHNITGDAKVVKNEKRGTLCWQQKRVMEYKMERSYVLQENNCDGVQTPTQPAFVTQLTKLCE